ncbi:GMC family oxidoreductase N-terminal domain-containing protein [Streptomyces sp. TRM 70361]|uniref:GMC family oxidoreductase n=1 Tax=Streptomyces sp. TRM 70361 TaxID=3116553 RepID=UPI002E7B4CE6|nr:GMC family oxidoreductase N-terminal domain-containing protein [Streptomyces sp. TRM 70361]MEE1939102.1 GMC family oxidoreductase N-terminal domain-containing protein [Streptomyces sp. TRM 70361]
MDATYDYLVVGAGSAGCAVAARLAADPQARVALVEAGGPDQDPAIRIPIAFPTLFGSEHDWDYRTTPQPGLAGRVIRCPRGRVLGGSSSINASVWTRGHRADFDGWAASGGSGWSYDDVEPYFRRAEHRTGGNGSGVYGTGGPLYVEDVRGESEATEAFLAACAELGLPSAKDVNAADNTGAARIPTTQRRGERWSSADGYLRSTSHPDLDVLTHLHVQRITIADRRATGIEALAQDGRPVTLTARREVIVSSGAINSPQLLMLSGIGPADHLAEHGIECVSPLPGVGSGLQDHLFTPLIVHCPQPVTLASAGDQAAVEAYKLHRRGPMTSNVAEAACFLPSDAGQSAPDLELSFLPVAFVNHGLEPPSDHALTIAVVLLQPHSTGYVRLRSASPADAPELDPGYLSDPAGDDIRRLTHGLGIARSMFGTAALAPYTGEPWYPDLDLDDSDSVEHHIRRRTDTVYHPVGTCRMGADDGAVVDAELRVHGVSGLRVVDASVMPRITRGHTHAPTVMIAERAADLVRGT